MPTLKKQVIESKNRRYEFAVKLYEPGEPLPRDLRERYSLSDEVQPEMIKPGERQFVTGIIAIYYNRNVGQGEPDWVDLDTLDVPVIEMTLERQESRIRELETQVRALKGANTKLKRAATKSCKKKSQ